MSRFRILVASAIALVTSPVLAQDLPLKPDRTLDYEVSSGTFMSIALSPDGKTILFDMLGEIYAMPSTGGTAQPIATGLALDTQPVFSPDGKWIAFVSDRSGGDNVWIARSDGTGARRITQDDDGAVRTSPEWSADGRAIFVSRHRIALDRYELWRHPIDGGPAELLVPIRKSSAEPRTSWQSTLGASASRDGNWLYYARHTGDLSFEDPVAWSIIRRNLANGAEEPVIVNSGGRNAGTETFFRPEISPDGKLLAYATRRLNETRLRIRDLNSGVDQDLGPAPLDMMNGAAWLDLIPHYAFTPDSKAILIAYNGRIERRPVNGSVISRIPFTAKLHLAVGPSTRQRIKEDTGPVRAKLPQGTVVSPDGRRVAFAALGGLYVQGFEGPSRRLPVSGDPAALPSWSPDGATIAYVTWNEADGGALWSVAADGSSPPRKLSDIPAYFTHSAFTPDGTAILVVRSAMGARQQTISELSTIRTAELVAIPPSGGAARVIARGRLGQRPHFVQGSPGTVYQMSDDGLLAIDLANGAKRNIARVKTQNFYFNENPAAVDDIRISPDGKWLAAQAREQIFLMPTPQTLGAEIDLSQPGNPGRQVTDIGADFFDWRSDGSIIWSVGNFLQILPNALAPVPKTHIELVAELPRARPAGSILLRGGRALTMAGNDAIIPDADILVTGDRIAAIGPRGSFAVPAGTSIHELAGKTVMPGFIDDHDHLGSIRRPVPSYEDWGLRARLAFGVTTSFDPSTLSIDQIAYQDLVDTGLMIAPRIRSTGPAIFSRERFTSLDQVRVVLRRYREAWGLRNIKQYRGENRVVREWIAIAARELGLQPTTEGSHNPKLILSQIIDGFAGNEHALPVAPLQEDVLQLITKMRTSYVATLLVNTSGPAAKHYYVAKYDPATDRKVQRFWSPPAIEAKLAYRPWASLTASRAPALAADAARLAAFGGLVGMGSHGDDPGIGYHNEMEAHVLGGMSPPAVLHAATAGAAETIGRLDDLGTLEVGKFADLVVLEADPLTDIHNTRSVKLVMRGGQLFDADTLDEIWPSERKLPAPWFAKDISKTFGLPTPPD